MASPERIYHGSVRIFSLVFVVLGLVILISTFAQGGGVLSLGVVLGFAFTAVGGVRLWMSGFFRGWRGRDRTRGRTPS